jgi:hypothetical protein
MKRDSQTLRVLSGKGKAIVCAVGGPLSFEVVEN